MIPLEIAGAVALAALIIGAGAPRRRVGPHNATRLGGINRIVGALAAAAALFALRSYLLPAIAAMVVGATATHLVRSRRRQKKMLADGAAVATAMAIIAGELRAGAQVGHSIERAGTELEDTNAAVATALLVAARTALAGGDGAASLSRSGEAIPELGTLARAWSVAHAHGISQLEMVEQARRRIDKATSQARKTQAKMQGAQVTAAILAVMPIFGIGMGFAMGVNVPAFLLTHPLGGILLVMGVGLECAGLLVSEKIMRQAA
ncbi:hypothetical protein PAB09_01475 [Corynebacterium sp. SCR221107]|uniref:type II secretion system F family protein n=1 Tax=Corynebacterium sp. SCR221107 TaxID=3017361 RepID=UPI0022EC43F1|nr:hypothetical protein [Corynebacterium sp. SCR221107]WBT09045.1 hypothetical protein PAB09_01475 [Corynebacterium sp. SCR221107]